MDHNKIGRFITDLRKEKGWTQQELGEKLFVTNKAVSKWERGLSLPDITILERLASILEVDVSEILQGERGKNKINVEEKIEQEIERIEQEKRMKWKKKWTKILSIFAVVTALLLSFLIFYNYKYHPKVIHEGKNNYVLGSYGKYYLEKDGLSSFINILEKTEDRNKEKTNISSLEISLRADGSVQSFIMNLTYFDEKLSPTGKGIYTYQNKVLEYNYEAKGDCSTVTDCQIQNTLIEEYAKSRNVEYIGDILKKIPFRKQIKASQLKRYVVSFGNTVSFKSFTPVIDLRDLKEAPVLSLEEYKQGKGGNVPSGIYLQITLSDGSSVLADEIYRYIFDPFKEDPLKMDYSMQTDYYINNGQLQFTRDYGNTWIEADLSKEQMDETLHFYRSISLLPSSWFLSENSLMPIAYFYGKDPKLKISTDNGESWDEKTFMMESTSLYKTISHRVVGFTDQNFGFVALGTDWSMGTGEEKRAYFTFDSGTTWEEIPLPENGTSHILMDMVMLDPKIGVVALKESKEAQFPLLYSTTSGGKSWSKVEYRSSNFPDSISYLTSLDAIEKQGDSYIITLGQGDSGTIKAQFRTGDMQIWNFKDQSVGNIHTVG